MPPQLNKSRLTLLALAPAVLLTLVTMLCFLYFFNQQAESQASDYGRATLLSVSELLAEYVEHENILSLTLLATRLQGESQIAAIEIYDDQGQLLAQAGSGLGGLEFEQQLIYQGAVIGQVRLGVKPPASFPANALLPVIATLLLFTLLVWQGQGRISAWLILPSDSGDHDSELPDIQTPAYQGQPARLVVKIRPGFYLDKFRDKFEYALGMYQGEVEAINQDEMVALFNSTFAAACGGLLAKALAAQLPGEITFGGALQVEDKDATTQRKRLTYLASIAEGELLVHQGTLDAAAETKHEIADDAAYNDNMSVDDAADNDNESVGYAEEPSQLKGEATDSNPATEAAGKIDAVGGWDSTEGADNLDDSHEESETPGYEFVLGKFQHSLIDEQMTTVLALKGTDLIERHASRIATGAD